MSENNIPHIVDQGASYEDIKPGSVFRIDPGHIEIFNQPKNVGCWVIGESLRIYVRKKGTESQIKATEETFGWQWEDGDMNDHFSK